MKKIKLWNFVGSSIRNGKNKVRLATDIGRKKVLEKTGNTNVVLHKLPKPMTKEQAHQWYKEQLPHGLPPV